MRMHDLLIIGAGPAGIYAGFQAGLRGVKAIIVDSLPMQGGLLTAFYPDKPIYDIPGFANIRADHFIDALMAQFTAFSNQIPISFNEKIIGLKAIQDGYEATSDQGKRYQARFVMIASGTGSLLPRQLNDVHPQVAPHVHYSIKDLSIFKGKRVALLGGGDSAFDWGNTLLPIAQSVTLIHRRHEFRALQYSIDQFKQRGQIKTPFEVQTIEKNHDLTLTLKHAESDNIELLQVDEMVVCYGFISSIGAYQPWGLLTKPDGIVVNTKMETNLANVFAVGNASTYEGKAKTIATAFGEVASVMEVINTRLFPGKKILYSSFLK